MNCDSCPEFLAIFSNDGDFLVKVKFKGTDAKIANQSMVTDEINKLIDPSTGSFFSRMYFDDHLYNVDRYSVDLIKKRVEITASQIKKDL